MTDNPTSAAIIPFGAPDDARGLHIARQLLDEMVRVGLGGSSAAAGLRHAVRLRLGNPPLWDAIAEATEALVDWAWHQPLETMVGAEAAMDRAAGWLHDTMPDRGPPFDEDTLGVLYDGQWTTYCLRTGARIEDHPTAPDWLYQIPMD